MKFVHIREKSYKGKELTVVPLGDCHYGAKDFNLKLFTNTINWIKNNKHARVILMGDLLDVGLKDSVGGGTYDNDIEPEQQINDMIDFLEPIKDKIWCMIGGNHEERIRSRTGIDINNLMAKALGIKYCGTSAYIKAMVGKQNYIIYATHGNSGSASVSGKLAAVMKYSNFNDADIYIMGHVHELLHHTTDYFKVDIANKMIVKDKRHYVVTGHFLNYGGYAEAKGYAPGKSGAPWVHLSGKEKEIKVSI